jgi:hypothetical protein
MSEEHTTADDHAQAGAQAPEDARAEITEEAAAEILELQDRALDSAELSRQLEDLTSVVLNSAEVSTRSASVAADVSTDMQMVVDKISQAHSRSIQHSKIILGALLLFIILAVGTFFAIATRMQQNIRQLDALALAVGKRVVDLDSTVGAFTESAQSLFELAEKMESMNGLPARIDQRFEDLNKSMQAVPEQVTAHSEKSLDAKIQALQKQLQTIDGKVQNLASRPVPQIKDNSQSVLNELQKLQKEVNGMQSRVAARPAEPPKAVEPPKPKTEPRPVPVEAKPAAPQVPNRDRVLMYPRPSTSD